MKPFNELCQVGGLCRLNRHPQDGHRGGGGLDEGRTSPGRRQRRGLQDVVFEAADADDVAGRR